MHSSGLRLRNVASSLFLINDDSVNLLQQYIVYVRDIRRYSSRTVQLYLEVLNSFGLWAADGDAGYGDEELISALTQPLLRSYEVYLLDERKSCPRTVNLHLSVLSGFCDFLVRRNALKSNPVKLVSRPKVEKRLPEYCRQESMEQYFSSSEYYASVEALTVFLHSPASKNGKELYERRLSRLVVSLLYGLGLRRSELMSMTLSNVDFGRKVVRITGKGNKMREIPLVGSLCDEIRLYLKALEGLIGEPVESKTPLLLTYTGRPLYPVYVDRLIKKELGGVEGITGRKSPHVLRHSIATELLNEGADIYSIKEMLGHSSLAATQVYTHNSISKLKQAYAQAHPRAKEKKD